MEVFLIILSYIFIGSITSVVLRVVDLKFASCFDDYIYVVGGLCWPFFIAILIPIGLILVMSSIIVRLSDKIYNVIEEMKKK